MQNESVRAKFHPTRPLPNLAGLFLTAFGLIILAWVLGLTWYDMTSWGKDIALIFFASRTDEAIGLGIGIKIVHYFLIGLALLLSGAIIFLRRWINALRARKMNGDFVVSIPKAMVDDIQKRPWFKYYRDIGEFILNAIKSSIENQEKRALTHETEEKPDAKVEIIEKSTPVSPMPTKAEKTRISQDNKPSGCRNYIGYLKTEHPKKTPIPNEYLTCSKIVECSFRVE